MPKLPRPIKQKKPATPDGKVPTLREVMDELESIRVGQLGLAERLNKLLWTLMTEGWRIEADPLKDEIPF